MKPAHLLALVLCVAAAPAVAQQTASDGQRFDVNAFRPTASPQDLVIVQQSRPMANLSLSAGLVLDFALDPLVLIQAGSKQKLLSVVGNRFTLDAVAAIGLLDWVELGVDMPLVLSQSSDNLQSIGTEGTIASRALGDLRLSGKVALPYLRRAPEGRGFGAAATFGLSFPTGSVEAFTGDGQIDVNPGLILDYRFGNGILLTLNGGYLTRPLREFNGLKLGPMATFGAGVEVPIVRKWGVTAVGEFYGSAEVLKTPGTPRAVPSEAILGLRFYGSSGLTFTVGGGAGCGCSFSSPSIRLFAALVWVPGKTKEREAIERFKDPPAPPVDPDGDGVIGDADWCPNEAGPVENHGCPDKDSDGDGIIDRLDECPSQVGPKANHGCPDRDSDGDGIPDRLDKCPDVPALPGHPGREGCPLAYVHGDRIIILDQVHFATDLDVILDESKLVLEEVARVLRENPQIQRVHIKGHTDVRASNEHNKDLSRRRAHSVEMFLIGQGIDPRRLRSTGVGHFESVADDSAKNEDAMALNRRVEFIIEKLPPKKAEPATLEGNRIQTVEPLAFIPGTDELLTGSFPLLDAVAHLINDTPSLERVRIEARDANLDLARRRAATVERYLLGQGVEHRRVRSVAVRAEVSAAPGARAVELVVEKLPGRSAGGRTGN